MRQQSQPHTQSRSRPRGRPPARSRPPRGGEPDAANGELNAGLVERFGRGSAFKPERGGGGLRQEPMRPVNRAIEQYMKQRVIGSGAPKWALRPEVPTADELLPYTSYPVVSASGWSTQDQSTASGGWGAVSTANVEALSANNWNTPSTQQYAPKQSAVGWDDSNVAANGWGEPSASANNAKLGNDWDNTSTAAATNRWDNTNTNIDAWDTSKPAADAWGTQDTMQSRQAGGEVTDSIPKVLMGEDKQVEESDTHYLKQSKGDDWQNQAPDENAWDKGPDTIQQAEPWQNEASQSVPEDTWSALPRAPGKTGSRVETESQVDEDDERFDNVANKIEGPWNSKKEYLRNHYLLLREDSLRPLRRALEYVRGAVDLDEDPSHSTVGIYDQVHVCGITFSKRGLGIRVSFSLGRVGKNIHWEQSKRLVTGSLIVLMSPDKTTCKVATVAARPLSNLAKNPPEIDLFLSRGEDLDIDCAQEWIIIEERSSFYEGQRHTMVALQRMLDENFPLQEHLVNVQQNVEPPRYVQSQSTIDVSDVLMHDTDHATKALDILGPWSEAPKTELDESQINALNTILTKRLALVQGPPGTGKTFVSVQALKILIRNMTPGDPPIIITCQTNHALDQLLLHVSEFEPKFIRLGGQSKDKDVIAKRTLYEVRREHRIAPFRGGSSWMALIAEMSKLLGPLIKGLEAKAHNREVIDLSLLRELEILSEKQCSLLVKGAELWITHGDEAVKGEPLMKWIDKSLEHVKPFHSPTLLEYEEINEADIGFEDVMEQDAEGVTGEDNDEIERLRGDYFMIGDTWTGKGSNNKASQDIALSHLKKDDLWKIKTADRGNVYRHLQRELKKKIAIRLRQLFPGYEAVCQDRKIHNWEADEGILKGSKVIGLTTTGVSKYRPLIASLRPKIVLIEEAAETLEAPVIAACVESVQHLILVGDHKQLRPHCHVFDLEQEPYNLNISLFERMVKNDVEFSVLRRQRRMKPEIRRLLAPIYGDKIKDHEVVKTRPPIPGMGGLTTWLYSHEWPDERDHESSSFNHYEAHLIYGLVQYLRYNGLEGSEITILTFYQGQRKLLARLLRQDNSIGNVKLVTVDSYQGEENSVVILSLVRSNMDGKIGFVGVENRVCVALSRAKRGFYIFGNAELLAGESKVWADVITVLNNGAVSKEVKGETGIKKSDVNPRLPSRRLGFALPLWCSKHRRMTYIQKPEDWEHNVGGCDLRCGQFLPCSHPCPERCHPWSHSLYSCRRPCGRELDCGHTCSLLCGDQPCYCKRCTLTERAADPDFEDLRIQTYNAERRHRSDSTSLSPSKPPVAPGSSKYTDVRTSVPGSALPPALTRDVANMAIDGNTTDAKGGTGANGRASKSGVQHIHRFVTPAGGKKQDQQVSSKRDLLDGAYEDGLAQESLLD